jgi:putative AlgH/UPF0301 family transcriptional regulator
MTKSMAGNEIRELCLLNEAMVDSSEDTEFRSVSQQTCMANIVMVGCDSFKAGQVVQQIRFL